MRNPTSLMLAALLVLSLVFAPLALAEETALGFRDLPQLIRPGKTERISFQAPSEGKASIGIRSADGSFEAALQKDIAAAAGYNSIFWNGASEDGALIQPGAYLLTISMANAKSEAALEVGRVSPQLNNLRISDPVIHEGQGWHISAMANMKGTLELSLLREGGEPYELLKAEVPAGELMIPWDGNFHGQRAESGRRSLSLTLTDPDGFRSNSYRVVVEIPSAAPSPAPEAAQPEQAAPPDEAADAPAADEGDEPSATEKPEGTDHYKVPSQEKLPEDRLGKDYWSLPVGKWDEAKIWEIMLQPLTVLEGRDQRETYKLRLEPDKSTKRDNIVGEITYVSQGVHVLETLDNGWSLVEAFNSSYGPNNRSRRGYGDTDEIIRGYVETSVLKQKTPRTDFGILIDKLKQEMYVFKEGKLLTTLLISTGNPTKQQPWNETPAGEFLMVSKVGEFNAGNLVCRMAMRINGGALIHEVPYIVNQSTGHWDYTIQERVLGEKASHGCIRVQRKNNEDGINMTWLWNNIKVNTKVLVWDDTGRYYDYPDDDLQLYYNPDRGQYYHSNQNCPSIRDVFLPLKGSMTYAELDNSEHQKLTACSACRPPDRKSKIDALNKANGY